MEHQVFPIRSVQAVRGGDMSIYGSTHGDEQQYFSARNVTA